MPNPTFEVIPFSTDAFRAALASSITSASQLDGKRQVKYLSGYLSTLGAQTLVIEHHYTDADYLDDFASYYVRAFEPFERRCKRLHFFDSKFDEDELARRLLAHPKEADARLLQEHYLGFVVARPLPEAIIGRTVLKTYPDNGGRRRFLATREYSANLLGTQLSLKSLAFQEQDTVLAACATVALWSAFQQTGTLFGTATPTPVQITRAAASPVSASRVLPSRGLTVAQMAQAVRAVGLEPEVVQCTAHVPLLSLIHAYLQFGLPVVLGLDIEASGYHAITVTGHALAPRLTHAYEAISSTSGALPNVQRIGQRIETLYVHDDGFGPFARLKAMVVPNPGPDESVVQFEGTWTLPGKVDLAKLTPRYLVIPVYHKVRLTFLDVQRWVTQLNTLLSIVVTNIGDSEWDVALTTTNDFKAHLRDIGLEPSQLRTLLFRQLPKYMWRATFGIGGATLMEVLLDATGIARSCPVLAVLYHGDQLPTQLRPIVTQLGADLVRLKLLDERLLTRLAESLA